MNFQARNGASAWCGELSEAIANNRVPLNNKAPSSGASTHDEWRRRLSACVGAEGGHFEHYLYDRYSQNNSVKMATL